MFGRAQAAKIRPADIVRYLRNERASAPVVANREVALLSNLLNLAVELDWMTMNQARQVRRNPETPRTRLVDPAELAAFVQWAIQQGSSALVMICMARFIALTGSRRAEFRELRWPQVGPDHIELPRAKQRAGQLKVDVIHISPTLREVLDTMRAQPGYRIDGPVFASPRTGEAYKDTGFKTMWGRLMQSALAAKVVRERFAFHDLRAYYTTTHKEQFGTLPDLHANPATTERVYQRARKNHRNAL